MTEYIALDIYGRKIVGREYVVRCEKCFNWGAMNDLYPPDYCPVVHKCTRPSDWCCWGARKGDK